MNNSAIQLQPGEDGERGAPAQRNRLINGQFSIWQRTTSFPAPVVPILGLVGYSADRWQWQAATDGAVMLGSGMTRQTFDPGQSEVPDNPIYFMRWEMTGMSIPTVFAASNLVQRIESVRTLSGKTATLSFWMRGDINGTIAMSLLQWPGGMGGTAFPAPVAVSLLPTNFTVTANTWTFHRVTLNIPSISGYVLGAANNDALYLRFHNLVDAAVATQQGFPTPISYTGLLDFANVQLEEGDIEVPEFEYRPIALELSLCQRYYQKSYQQSVIPGTGSPVTPEKQGEEYLEANGTGGVVNLRYPVTMRSAPAISLIGSDGVPNQAFSIIGVVTGLSIFSIGEASTSVIYGIVAPAANDDIAYSYHYTADAEL